MKGKACQKGKEPFNTFLHFVPLCIFICERLKEKAVFCKPFHWRLYRLKRKGLESSLNANKFLKSSNDFPR